VRLSPSEILSRLNSSYWFVPLVVTLAGVLLALVLLLADAAAPPTPASLLEIMRPSSADGARALLSAVIGAMITAISVTFSVTIVALTVAAQHFGPRVLNNFVRQTSAQLVLGTFMATFAYSVLALGAIRGSGPDADIPEIAVTGAVVLVILSIGALIYYVHYVSTTLQIGELATAIVLDLRNTVERQREGTDPELAATHAVPEAPADAVPVSAVESGYVQRIDYASIVEGASDSDAVVWIRREPGAFLVGGTPLALVHPPAACNDTLAEQIRHSCIVGADRTYWHDPEFAVKQLVEIALRALSPGVNEPFTAMTCIDRLTEGLAAAAVAPPPTTSWVDRGGKVRVWVQVQPFPLLVRAAFDPIRIFAGPNPAIYARLVESLAELGLVARGERERELLREQADGVLRAAERELVDTDDLSYVLARHRKAIQQLTGMTSATRR
jgi:uncharacterized membrane protein